MKEDLLMNLMQILTGFDFGHGNGKCNLMLIKLKSLFSLAKRSNRPIHTLYYAMIELKENLSISTLACSLILNCIFKITSKRLLERQEGA